MNRTSITQAVIWLDQLAAKAKAESAKLRDQLSADARAELEEQGTAPTWRLPDVATISTAVSHQSVVVTDEKAFAEWAEKRYPTEVETVKVIRPVWRTHLLATAMAEGEAVCLPDGEVIPGLAVRPGGGFAGVTIRVAPAAKQVFGLLAEHGLRELAASSGPHGAVVLAELDHA